MRTVRRQSLKLNLAKFDALERIARASASDKQAHLDFYQHHLNFSEAHSYRLRRNELKTTDHHASLGVKRRARPRELERAHQVALIKWVRTVRDIFPVLKLLYAVPNGGKRNLHVVPRQNSI